MEIYEMLEATDNQPNTVPIPFQTHDLFFFSFVSLSAFHYFKGVRTTVKLPGFVYLLIVHLLEVWVKTCEVEIVLTYTSKD